MKSKTDKPETKEYSLSEKEFTQFAKALVAVPKRKLDKELAKDTRRKESHSKP